MEARSDTEKVRLMTKPVCRVTVSCRAPEDNTPVAHLVTVNADGSISIEQHEQEAWTQSLAVMHALGDPGDTNPCVWWRTPSSVRFWDQGRLSVVMGHDDFFSAHYAVTEWEIETVGEWTEEAQIAVYNALGISLPEDLTLYSDISPADVFRVMKKLPSQGLHGTITYQTVASLIRGLRSSGERIEDWLATYQNWFFFPAWQSIGYTAEETGAFCVAYDSASDKLQDMFGSNVLARMVFHSPQALAAAFQSAGISKARGLALMERAPHTIYLEWPGVAEQGMPQLPATVPPEWVAEALATIPNAGFIPGRDRPAWAEHLVSQFPDYFSEYGDPAHWPSDWCWPTASAIARKSAEDL